MSLGLIRPGSTASTVSAGRTDTGGRASSRRSPWADSSTVSSSSRTRMSSIERPSRTALRLASSAASASLRRALSRRVSLSAADSWVWLSARTASTSARAFRAAASPRLASLRAPRSLR